MKNRLLATGAFLLLSGILHAQYLPAKTLHFDGNDDYVEAPYQSYFHDIKTIELRVRPDYLSSNTCLIASRDEFNTLFSVHMTNSEIGFWDGNNYNIVPYYFTMGTWYHITLRFNYSSTEVLVNNVYIGETYNTMSNQANLPLMIGRPYPTSPSEQFGGAIDDIRFWNYIRSNQEIAADINSTLTGSEYGLLAAYSFNHGIDAGYNGGEHTLDDVSPNNNDGTLQNFSLNSQYSNWLFGSVTSFNSNTNGVVPVIQSVSPMSGPVGTAVVIHGFNFNSDPSKNTVYFGAVKAEVQSADPTFITAIAPFSTNYVPITVTNTDLKTSATAPLPFITTLPAAPIEFGFNEWSSFNSNPGGIAYGDLDGDGKPDMVTGYEAEPSIIVWSNVAQRRKKIDGGSFIAQWPIALSGFATGVTLGDINHDGKLDIVAAVPSLQAAVLLLNTSAHPGNFSFDAPIYFPTSGSEPLQLVKIGDMNQDGKNDLVFLGANSITVMQHNGDDQTPGFNYAFGNALSGNPSDLVVADLNNDSRADIAITDATLNIVELLENRSSNGTLTFGNMRQLVVGNEPTTIVVADLNIDGFPELITSNRTSGTISILQNISGIDEVNFYPKADITMPRGTMSVTAGDVDGDGKPELLNANQNDYSFTILKNSTTPWNPISETDFSASDFSIRTNPDQVFLLDIDGDGRQDVAATSTEPNWDGSLNYYVNYLHGGIIINYKPVINDIYPLTGVVGSTVTINGSMFNNDLSKNIVKFGSVTAQVISGDANNLVVTVPQGATHSAISVINSENKLTGISFYKFLPSIGASTLAFSGETKVMSIAQPVGFSVADFDDDGNQDLSFGGYYSDFSMVLRNRSAGILAFDPESLVFTLNPVTTYSAGDFNGDGKPDMLISNGDMVADIRYNNSSPGNYSFNSNAGPQITENAKRVSIADVDGNGMNDFASMDTKYGIINITLNLSTPQQNSFSGLVPVNGVPSPASILFADLNHDHKPDLLVTSKDANTVYIYYNYSEVEDVNFQLEQIVQLSGTPGEMAVGDLNGDGTQEVVVTLVDDGKVAILKRNPYMLVNYFDQVLEYAAGDSPAGIAVGDMNGDGTLDIVLTNEADNTVSVLANRSTVNNFIFDARQVYAAGVSPSTVQIADFNNDGRPDIAAANFNDLSISILTNTGAFITLPVKLNSFTALKREADVQLKWTTSSEINTDHFEVEKSLDGREFRVIARVAAAGSISGIKDYFSIDDSPEKGLNYYRIKSVDQDGKFAYTAIVSVEWNFISTAVSVKLAPQPFTSILNVSVKGLKEDGVFKIFDLGGKPVQSVQVRYDTPFTISRGKLAAGIYFYQVISRSGKVHDQGKIIIQ